jgi:4a-hydroxytetrahydrobiopterin dehydratase
MRDDRAMTEKLVESKCLPCEGKIPKLDDATIDELMKQLPSWGLHEGRLRRTLEFKDFAHALLFVNAVGNLAEHENHHPDVHLHQWNKVTFELYTHDLQGLSHNDFVLAAKIDALV